MEDFSSNLAAKVVDDKACASYRWAGTTMQIESGHAQRALHHFCCSRDSCSGLYVVGGVVKESVTPRSSVKPREICLVSFSDIEASKKRFASVTSVHAYSAQPTLTSELNALLYASDVPGLANEMLTSQSDSAQLYQHNRGSAIHCSEVRDQRFVCLAPLRDALCPGQPSRPARDEYGIFNGARQVRVAPPGKVPSRNSGGVPASSSSLPSSGTSSSASSSSTKAAAKNLKPTSAASFFGKGSCSISAPLHGEKLTLRDNSCCRSVYKT
jgi:hypothetical protein